MPMTMALQHANETAKRIPDVTIMKYKYTRFWAVWVDEELLAVVCYKKGANAIRDLLLKLFK